MPKLKSLKPAIDPKFLEFLNKDFLVDVSLVADGFMMSCHGNVLAAASTYFEVRKALKIVIKLFFGYF